MVLMRILGKNQQRMITPQATSLIYAHTLHALMFISTAADYAKINSRVKLLLKTHVELTMPQGIKDNQGFVLYQRPLNDDGNVNEMTLRCRYVSQISTII